MTKTFAYECFADRDVFCFLRDDCGFSLKSMHAYGQGEVVNAVLVRGTAEIGLVDEDPLASHHAQRDQTEIVSTTHDVVLRRRGNRHLIIIKPELEECFLRSMKRVGLSSKLPARATELRAILNLPSGKKHAAFRDELRELRQESVSRHIESFVTSLESIVRTLLV